jgi:Iap family predicted aminopeptidase
MKSVERVDFELDISRRLKKAPVLKGISKPYFQVKVQSSRESDALENGIWGLAPPKVQVSVLGLRSRMRTSFHHQPEAQHPKISSDRNAGRPITPSKCQKQTSIVVPAAGEIRRRPPF